MDSSIKNILSDQFYPRRIVRYILDRILPSHLYMPIWLGPMRGKRWIVGSFIHKCWLGIYEWRKQHYFCRDVHPNFVVFDVGANVGFYTILSSLLVGGDGEVVAFEPVPRNMDYLKKHLIKNGINNVKTVEVAVSAKSGVANFSIGSKHSMGHLTPSGQVEVEIVSLDDFVAEGHAPVPNVIKIDVEGAELLVLQGADCLLKRFYPTIFLATHGQEVHTDCCNHLQSLGYKITSIDGKNVQESRELVAVIETL